jgi:hypothetical protein
MLGKLIVVYPMEFWKTFIKAPLTERVLNLGKEILPIFALLKALVNEVAFEMVVNSGNDIESKVEFANALLRALFPEIEVTSENSTSFAVAPSRILLA